MSAWRRKAIEEFSDLKREFQAPHTTIYSVFFALLPRCLQAHRDDDRQELQRIYNYAAWCSRQRAKDLWNAAGVCFYEHLVDQPETIRALPRWLDAEIFRCVFGLFELRLGEARATLLRERFLKARREGRSTLDW